VALGPCDESGRWLERDFCAACGTPIGLRLEAVPGIRSLALGSFDETAWYAAADITTRHVFLRSAIGLVELPAHVAQYDAHFRA